MSHLVLHHPMGSYHYLASPIQTLSRIYRTNGFWNKSQNRNIKAFKDRKLQPKRRPKRNYANYVSRLSSVSWLLSALLLTLVGQACTA